MTASVSLAPPPSVDDVPPMLRTVRTVGVAVALLVAAFLALSGSGDSATASVTTGRDTAGLAVATDDLVNRIAAADDVARVTGGFVPGVGVVITAEIEELTSAQIDTWTGNALRGETLIAGQLDETEEVIFLLDIAQPERVSRLVAVSSTDIQGGSVVVREAPAISTAPLIPTFEPQAED
ncbi:MAG: hypothetical protein AAF567_04580 [Actinomycetota bacterium]